MLSIKNTLIAGALAFAVGFLTGYSARDDQAEIERLNVAKYALDQEKANLIQQLEVEHEHQKTAQINAAKTQEDLDNLEKRYASAIDELNALQLQFTEYTDSDTATCPQMPPLPQQYHKVNVDAVEKTKEHFRSYLMTR